MANIEKAFQNKPKLLGFSNNSFGSTQPQFNNTFNNTNAMPFNNTYGGGGFNNTNFTNNQQFNNTLQFQHFQQQQNQKYTHLQNQQKQFEIKQNHWEIFKQQKTLKLNQASYQPVKGNKSINYNQLQRIKADKPPKNQNFTLNFGGENQNETSTDQTTLNFRRGGERRPKRNRDQQRQQLIYKKQYLLEISLDDIEENQELLQQLPECQVDPEQCAIEYEQNKIRNEFNREYSPSPEYIIDKQTGKKILKPTPTEQYLEQKNKTEHLINDCFLQEVQKLEEKAQNFEDQIHENQITLQDIGNDTKNMQNILNIIRNETKKSIKDTKKMDQQDIQIQENHDIADINEALQEQYQENEVLYGKISEILKDIGPIQDSKGFNLNELESEKSFEIQMDVDHSVMVKEKFNQSKYEQQYQEILDQIEEQYNIQSEEKIKKKKEIQQKQNQKNYNKMYIEQINKQQKFLKEYAPKQHKNIQQKTQYMDNLIDQEQEQENQDKKKPKRNKIPENKFQPRTLYTTTYH